MSVTACSFSGNCDSHSPVSLPTYLQHVNLDVMVVFAITDHITFMLILNNSFSWPASTSSHYDMSFLYSWCLRANSFMAFHLDVLPYSLQMNDLEFRIYKLHQAMKLSSNGFLVMSVLTGLSRSLPIVQSSNSRGISDGPDLSARYSGFEPSYCPDSKLDQDKMNLAINPTILLAEALARQTHDKQVNSQYRNVVAALNSRRTPSSEVLSTLEARPVSVERAPHPYSRAYGRAHDYALVCAGNRWDTSYCQGAFLRYSCNSQGKLVQMEGGTRSETCDSICTCVDLSPKPFCLSGYLGTTTCF